MTRIDYIPEDRLDDAQRAFHDLVQGQRGGVRGPFAVLTHAPEIGTPLATFIDQLLNETRVPKQVKETAILTIARHYTAQYEWYVHEKGARRAGLDDAIIEALRHGRRPEFSDPVLEVAHDMAQEMCRTNRLSDETYARAAEIFDTPALVEMVTVIGLYHAVSVLLVSFDVEVPDPDAVLLK